MAFDFGLGDLLGGDKEDGGGLLGGLLGGDSGLGNLFGAALVGSQIYNQYQGNQLNEDKWDWERDKFNQQFAFDQQQHQDLLDFRKEQLASEKEIAGAKIKAQMKIKRAELIDKAYEAMATLAQQGRMNEAKQLGELVASLQAAFLSNSGGIR